MARNVNVWLEGWHKTGQSINVDQYEVGVTIQWTDAESQAREHIETVRFPNVLTDVPAAWLKEALADLMLRAVRKKAGMD